MGFKVLALVLFACVAVDQSRSSAERERFLKCLYVNDQSLSLMLSGSDRSITYLPETILHIMDGVSGHVEATVSPSLQLFENVTGSVATDCRQCNVNDNNGTVTISRVAGDFSVAIIQGSVCEHFRTNTITIVGVKGKYEYYNSTGEINFPRVTNRLTVGNNEVGFLQRDLITLTIQEGGNIHHHTSVSHVAIYGQIKDVKRNSNQMLMSQVGGDIFFDKSSSRSDNTVRYMATVSGATVNVTGSVVGFMSTHSAANAKLTLGTITSVVVALLAATLCR